jgi:hypothetical protein
MDEKQRQELALFRFSLIAPLINDSLTTSVKEYLETVCAKTYNVPGLGQREFSPRTILYWRSLYRQFGLEGLKGKVRCDQGHYRRLSLDAQGETKAVNPGGAGAEPPWACNITCCFDRRPAKQSDHHNAMHQKTPVLACETL